MEITKPGQPALYVQRAVLAIPKADIMSGDPSLPSVSASSLMAPNTIPELRLVFVLSFPP